MTFVAIGALRVKSDFMIFPRDLCKIDVFQETECKCQETAWVSKPLQQKSV